MEFKITVLNKNNEIKASMEGAAKACRAWKGDNWEGTRIFFGRRGTTRF